MKELKGKVAIVTGASSGIGRATAKAFARQGTKVIVADVMADGGEQTVQMIKDAGGEAIYVNCDVAQADQVQAMVEKTVQAYGRLDYAVNNASINGTHQQSLTDISEEEWDRVTAINLKGTWLCMKHQIPVMVKTGHGAIVNTASIAGLVATTDSAAYIAAKHGVIGLTKSAAAEYGKKGIRVNAVCPGLTDTPMSARAKQLVPAEHLQRFIEAIPLGFEAQPENLADPIVWLCTEGACYMTGATIVVDGGITIV